MDRTATDILSLLQRQVLDAVFEEEVFQRAFYLTGGTALAAFYLSHRYSDDLDFFTNEPDVAWLWPTLQQLQTRLPFTVDSRTPRFIRVRFAEELRVDFVHDVSFRLGIPVQHSAWRIDTLENIAVNKVTAIQGRLDVKDYIDLYLLLKDKPERIFTWLKYANQKDASIDPFVWSRVIGDVDTFRMLPRMIVPLDLKELHAFYRQLRQRILRSLKPHTS